MYSSSTLRSKFLADVGLIDARVLRRAQHVLLYVIDALPPGAPLRNEFHLHAFMDIETFNHIVVVFSP